MSVFGLNTFSAMRTPVAALNVASGTNVTTSTLPATRVQTSTKPATTTTGTAAGVVVQVPPERTYMKLVALCSNSGGTDTLHVIGWNLDASGTWRPQSLCSWTVVHSGTSMSINGSNLFAGITHTKLAGDAKNYDVNGGISNSGFLLLDACGCELVEIVFTAASSFTANALVGFI